MPAGFHISLYALVPDARHITVGPQGVPTFKQSGSFWSPASVGWLSKN
jgi:hypothetical protein